jgi:hypothetical protein
MSKNITVKSTMFPQHNIHEYTDLTGRNMEQSTIWKIAEGQQNNYENNMRKYGRKQETTKN